MDEMETNHQKAIKTTLLSMLANIVLAAVKGVAGFFGNSYALIADAIESLTDVFSSFLVLIGLRYASKPADSNHPYGHGKIEPLLTFVVVVFLVLSAGFIAYRSIQHIQEPHPLPKAYTLYVLGAIILGKELIYRMILRKGEEINSTAVKADAWHHRSDAITSLAAFIGIAVARIFGEGYASADDWAALLASVVIVYNAFLIARPALGEIMDEHVYDELVQQIRVVAQEVDGVRGTEKCYVRKAGLDFYVDLHLVVDGAITVQEGHAIAHRVKKHLQLQFPELADVLIHVEPDEEQLQQIP